MGEDIAGSCGKLHFVKRNIWHLDFIEVVLVVGKWLSVCMNEVHGRGNAPRHCTASFFIAILGMTLEKGVTPLTERFTMTIDARAS